MAFIGNTPTTQAFTPAIDYFSGNASTTAFTLSRPVASVVQVQAVISNVPQNPGDAFTVNGNTITFTSAPPSGTNNIYVYYTSPITQVTALPQSPQVFGNLQMSSPGGNIVGDFTNATILNRNMFQTSTTNGSTGIYALPNGTSTAASWQATNNSDPTNASKVLIATNGSTDVQLVSGRNGTGTYLPLTFYTNGSEQARIDTSGNVGIGTSSPSTKLHVSGGTSSVSGSNGITGIANGNTSGGMKLYAFTAAGNANGYLAFEGYDKEYGRFDSSGNLLVGTTTNSFSSTNYGIVLNPNSESFWVANTASNLIAFNINTNNNIFKFFRSGTQVGAVSVTTTNTTYATSSDYRLKNTIAPMTGALAKVAALKPVTYKWNVDDSDGEGFIAHELAEVIPQAVVGEKDGVNEDGTPKYQGIDTSFLVATLTAAIQEQQILITQLTERISVLENK